MGQERDPAVSLRVSLMVENFCLISLATLLSVCKLTGAFKKKRNEFKLAVNMAFALCTRLACAIFF